MKRDNVNYVLAGGFVLAAMIGVLALLYAIMGRTGPNEPYHAYYDNVSGVKRGTAVLYEGYRVGQVEGIVPEHSPAGTRYRVNLSVQAGWPIREGSVARIAASGLISAITIDIAAGSGEGRVPPGSTLAAESRVNLFAALSDAANDFRVLSRDTLRPLAESLEAELTGLMADLRSLTSDSLRPLVDRIGRHVDDPALFGDLKRLLARLGALTERLDGFMAEETLDRAGQALANVAVLSGELVETNRRLQGLLDGGLDGRVAAIAGNLERLSAGLLESNARLQRFLDERNAALVRETLESVAEMSEAIGRDARAVSELVDAETRDRVKGMLASLERLAEELRSTNRDVGALLGERNRARIASTLTHADRLGEELRGTNAALQGFLDEENRAQVKLALGSVGRVASSLEQVAASVEGVVSERNRDSVERILANVEALTGDLATLVRSLDATRRRLDAVLGDVGGLVTANGEHLSAASADLRRTLGVAADHVGAITHHLEGTTRNLHEFTRQIRENPALLIQASPQRERGRSAR